MIISHTLSHRKNKNKDPIKMATLSTLSDAEVSFKYFASLVLVLFEVIQSEIYTLEKLPGH